MMDGMTTNSPDHPAGPPTASLFRRLLARAAVYPIVVMAILATVLMALILHLLSVMNTAEQSDLIIAKATLIEKLMVDRETGLRGYVITKDTSFLEPYTRAQMPLQTQLVELKSLLGNDADQAARLGSVQADLITWQQYADEVKTTIDKGGDATSIVL